MGEWGRLAFSLLSVAPVRARRMDRDTAGGAMLLAPLVGASIGLTAGLVLLIALIVGIPALVAGALGVGMLALVTRGLHLDGLADTADGLGSYGDPDRALAIMKAPDIGPFGVITMILVAVTQVGCLAVVAGTHAVLPALLLPAVGAATGRLAVTWACRVGVPAARPSGLGALVAETLTPVTVGLTTLVVVALAAVATGVGGPTVWRGPLAVAAGLVVAWALVRHCVRRFGGITGDVLGAACEVSTTAALVVLVIQPWSLSLTLTR
ncbi:adenosylcobinamide-GDP ribazoletransferase [Cryptosporangium phraense]|uniref:adenosylcobinamide-GDP ribazoletransferase n=1 Tax=Cryptosporangium phraense TaxID=2593070 RepID=UPI001F10C721|nr:adenosylcobinamide-GDP ribazoletransferase [Cryptosporangium phraense]